MAEASQSVNLTFCQVCEINYCLPTALCDRCQQLAPFFTTAERCAIDLNVDHPVLLHVTVSVHHCSLCHHYFRVQPPFLRRDAIYASRVVDKAVQSVYEDGMAMRRVTARMARDFWVQPSEGTIRAWCRTYSAAFDFEAGYLKSSSPVRGDGLIETRWRQHQKWAICADPTSSSARRERPCE